MSEEMTLDIAYAFATRQGIPWWSARIFALWCCNGGWHDGEHVDAAWDRYTANAIVEVTA